MNPHNSTQLENVNIINLVHLLSPKELKAELPSTELSNASALEGRSTICNILDNKDTRLLGVVGPCSIYDHDATMEYAHKFKVLREKVSDRMYLVMRVYFEKPRTTIGWRGLIVDPDMDNSNNIQKGLKFGRRILLDINALGVPTGSEYLDPIVPNYIDDLVCWASIGARTIESQTHRDMASGISVPVGFKNSTGGEFSTAVNAMVLSSTPRGFIGANKDGDTCIVHTKGNKYTHLILRGGRSGPNYFPENIAMASDTLKAVGFSSRIMIDCSHDNSLKDHRNQSRVLDAVINQYVSGETKIKGFMLESNLHEGNQKITNGRNNLKHGVSVTDACMSFEETEEVILRCHERLKNCSHAKDGNIDC